RDPMTSFTPAQLVGGAAMSFGGGLLAAYISPIFGFFALFVAFFAGGVIAEAVTRITGYKVGPMMHAVVYGGIVVGALVAFGIVHGELISSVLQYGPSAGADQHGPGIGNVLAQEAFWAFIGTAAACVGARSRLR
ncbi:MAG TPA: hypothetical protein VIH37_13225, partial [Candidatus Limnocylindrales bacterium]